MNLHEIIDEVTISLSALALGKRKFFSESLESPSLVEHLHGVGLNVPRIRGERTHELTAETLVSELDTAFRVVRWRGEGYPTIIYHHGMAERPFGTSRFAKSSLQRVLGSGDRKMGRTNLIALRAPFHNALRTLPDKMVYLSNFVAMLTVSVVLAERLVRQIKEEGGGLVMLSGISLGGWVTNLHRAHHDSADLYVPILAGAALDDVFVDSVYRKMATKKVEIYPEKVWDHLNFEPDFEKVESDNVFPLLARYDQVIRYERQKSCYGDSVVGVLEKGHITAALASAAIRRHIEECLNAVENIGPGQ